MHNSCTGRQAPVVRFPEEDGKPHYYMQDGNLIENFRDNQMVWCTPTDKLQGTKRVCPQEVTLLRLEPHEKKLSTQMAHSLAVYLFCSYAAGKTKPGLQTLKHNMLKHEQMMQQYRQPCCLDYTPRSCTK
jgi:hypothetical protein